MRQKTVLPETSKFLTVGQAAELLGVTEQHIYNQCKSGEIKSVKVGNVVRINKAEFLDRIGINETDAAHTAAE